MGGAISHPVLAREGPTSSCSCPPSLPLATAEQAMQLCGDYAGSTVTWDSGVLLGRDPPEA